MHASLLLLALTNPASAAKFDPTSVHKVAVVGFGGELALNPTQTSSGSGAVDTFKAVKGAVDGAKDVASGEAQKLACDHANEAYTIITSGLTTGMAWEILPREQLVADTNYVGTRDALLTRLGGPSAKVEEWCMNMKPTQMISAMTTNYLKQEERDALIDALGVDALVVPNIKITGEDSGVSVGGIGTSRVKPTTSVWVTIYTKGQKKAVFKGFATGKKTEEAIKADFGNGQDDAQAWPILVQSMELGAAKFGEKFGTAAAK